MSENQDFVRAMPMNRDLSKSSTREREHKVIAGGKSDQESPMSRYNLP